MAEQLKRLHDINNLEQFKDNFKIKRTGDRKQKGGVIWHTQGSGKSLTMVFLPKK